MKIPQITDKRLEDLLLKIRPVVRMSIHSRSIDWCRFSLDDAGSLYFIEAVNPRTDTFHHSVIPSGKANVKSKPYNTIYTIHNAFGYQANGPFSPSIAEVFAQLPESEIERCAAFETTYAGYTPDRKYTLGKTMLYEK